MEEDSLLIHESYRYFWKVQYWVSPTHSTPSGATHEEGMNGCVGDKR